MYVCMYVCMYMYIKYFYLKDSKIIIKDPESSLFPSLLDQLMHHSQVARHSQSLHPLLQLCPWLDLNSEHLTARAVERQR